MARHGMASCREGVRTGRLDERGESVPRAGRSWAALEPTHLRNDRRDRAARWTVVWQQWACARGALQEWSDRRGRESGGERGEAD